MDKLSINSASDNERESEQNKNMLCTLCDFLFKAAFLSIRTKC